MDPSPDICIVMHPSPDICIVLRSQRRRRHGDDDSSSIDIQGPWESIVQILESVIRSLANDNEDYGFVIKGTGTTVSALLRRMPEDRFTVLKHHADMPATAADMTPARSFGPEELILAGNGAIVSDIIAWMPEDHFTAQMYCGNEPLTSIFDRIQPIVHAVISTTQPVNNHEDDEETDSSSSESSSSESSSSEENQ
ncbi:hypothetical protein NUW58_g814 [Xylaria curta]|uniref:Uncharacterized protein n=1 Tax=Xylaria curta TaxID=42375 RepID=A0ACC1PP79_9PEZI|nr:hypothetical protein NUW58_g814 [Xylaria curta]